MKLRSKDGHAHFSDLKYFAASPLHYKHHILEPKPATRAMRLGTCAHAHLLGQRPGLPLRIFEGKSRRGKDWDAFEADALAENAEIVTVAEWELGRAIANATRTDPVAAKLLDGARFEVPIQWNEGGVTCSTWGLDVLREDEGVLADYKSTRTAHPRQLQNHAIGMQWHAQLAMYRRGMLALGMRCDRVLLIATESSAPHATTVLEMSPELLEEGDKIVTAWIEQLRSCEENDHWPSYTEHVEPWTPPAWMTMGIDFGPGDDDDDAEAA